MIRSENASQHECHKKPSLNIVKNYNKSDDSIQNVVTFGKILYFNPKITIARHTMKQEHFVASSQIYDLRKGLNQYAN